MTLLVSLPRMTRQEDIDSPDRFIEETAAGCGQPTEHFPSGRQSLLKAIADKDVDDGAVLLSAWSEIAISY